MRYQKELMISPQAKEASVEVENMIIEDFTSQDPIMARND